LRQQHRRDALGDFRDSGVAAQTSVGTRRLATHGKPHLHIIDPNRLLAGYPNNWVWAGAPTFPSKTCYTARMTSRICHTRCRPAPRLEPPTSWRLFSHCQTIVCRSAYQRHGLAPRWRSPRPGRGRHRATGRRGCRHLTHGEIEPAFIRERVGQSPLESIVDRRRVVPVPEPGHGQLGGRCERSRCCGSKTPDAACCTWLHAQQPKKSVLKSMTTRLRNANMMVPSSLSINLELIQALVG